MSCDLQCNNVHNCEEKKIYINKYAENLSCNLKKDFLEGYESIKSQSEQQSEKKECSTYCTKEAPCDDEDKEIDNNINSTTLQCDEKENLFRYATNRALVEEFQEVKPVQVKEFVSEIPRVEVIPVEVTDKFDSEEIEVIPVEVTDEFVSKVNEFDSEDYPGIDELNKTKPKGLTKKL